MEDENKRYVILQTGWHSSHKPKLRECAPEYAYAAGALSFLPRRNTHGLYTALSMTFR